MPRFRADEEFGIRPRGVQVERALHRADHVVAAVHDHAGDVRHLRHVAQQLVVGVEEPLVHEVMVLDARERQREARIAVAGFVIPRDAQVTRPAFPDAPRLRGGELRRLVAAGEATMVGVDQVAAFLRRDRREVMRPRIREQARRAFLVEPLQLPAAQHEDAAQHQLGHPLRVGLRIGQRQGGAPAAAEHLPAVDAEVLAQFLDVGHQVPGGVVHQIGMRRGAARAALVEQHDAVFGRVVELAHLVGAAAAGAAVQHDHRLAAGVAALFVVQHVAVIDLERAGVVRGDGGVKRAHARPRG